jgi:hypothetical protein
MNRILTAVILSTLISTLGRAETSESIKTGGISFFYRTATGIIIDAKNSPSGDKAGQEARSAKASHWFMEEAEKAYARQDLVEPSDELLEGSWILVSKLRLAARELKADERGAYDAESKRVEFIFGESYSVSPALGSGKTNYRVKLPMYTYSNPPYGDEYYSYSLDPQSRSISFRWGFTYTDHDEHEYFHLCKLLTRAQMICKKTETITNKHFPIRGERSEYLALIRAPGQPTPAKQTNP